MFVSGQVSFALPQWLLSSIVLRSLLATEYAVSASAVGHAGGADQLLAACTMAADTGLALTTL